MDTTPRLIPPTHPKKDVKRKKRIRIWLIVLGMLVAIRIALPYVILHFANEKLAALDGHYGHIEDIDLALIRGAYKINDIYINKVDEKGNVTAHFFKAPVIDLSVEWRAIFEGKVVAEVEFEHPVVNYTKDANVGEQAPEDSTNFIQLIKDFVPLDINRFAVNNGEVHYIDPASSPLVDVPLTAIYVEGRGLTNEPKEGVLLPATIDMSASLYDGGLNIGVKLDPLNKQPTFDLNGTLTKTELVYLNPFFTEYANFDLKQGTMEIATEFAAKDGQFAGYVKPIIKDLDIVQFEKEEGNIAQIAWEALIGTVAEVFQNQPKEQLATRVTINGKFNDPNVAVFNAIISVLKNAFVRALQPSVENVINLQSVDEENKDNGFLKRLFGKDEPAQVEEKQAEKTKREQRKEARQEKREERKKEKGAV